MKVENFLFVEMLEVLNFKRPKGVFWITKLGTLTKEDINFSAKAAFIFLNFAAKS